MKRGEGEREKDRQTEKMSEEDREKDVRREMRRVTSPHSLHSHPPALPSRSLRALSMDQ